MRITAAAVTFCLLILGIASSAHAQVEAAKPTNIPAQELGSALASLANSRGVQIVYRSQIVSRLRTRGASGDLTIGQALSQLLAGTGLAYRYLDANTITVESSGSTGTSAKPSPRHPDSPSKSVSKPPAGTGGGTDPASSAQSPQAGLLGLQEVVVTATRRRENILSVPVAVSAFSGAELRTRHVETAVDLANYVPSLSVSSGVDRDDYTFAIRGMGPTGGSGPGAVLGGGGTGVVTYFAEVPVSGGGPGLFYDLQSVQVAKGPQGTLFGKNTTGGVVLFVPEEPRDSLEGYVRIGGGDYSLKSATAMLNVPVVTDRLLVRLSGQTLSRRGFTVDRGPLFPGKDYDNRDYWAARLSVLARPIDGVENYTILSALHSDEHGDGYVLSAVNPSGPFAPLLLPFFAQQQAAGVRSTSLSDAEVDKRYDYGVINRTTWSATDRVTAKNIFSYQVQKWRNGNDIDASPYVINDLVAPRSGAWHTQVGTYTEEPQLQGTALHGDLRYTAGAYYEDGRNIGTQPYEVDVALGNFVIVQPDQTNTERSRAAYGQTTYKLGDIARSLSRWALTTGYRYTWDEYAYGITAYSPSLGGGCLTTPGVYPQSSCTFTASGSSSGSSWTVGLEYHPQRDTLAYLRSSRGYVPGGFNPSLAFAPGGVDLPQFRFAPESADDVELGVKSAFTLAGTPVQMEADIFDSDFRNIQRLVSETLPGGVESNFTANASQARIDGFEFQATAAPARGLHLTAAYSYNHGKYTKIDPAAAPSLVGIPFAYLPQHKASATVSYALPLPETVGRVVLDAAYSYQSRYFDAPAVQLLDYISGYGLLNGRVEWRQVMGSDFDMSAFVTNATNKIYRVGQYSNYVTDSRITSFYGEPRMFGVEVEYRFGALR